jgi:hypothetical protein
MLSLASKFVAEGPSNSQEATVFGLQLTKHVVEALRKEKSNMKERVADAFPRESVAVEDFLKQVVLPNLNKLSSSEVAGALRLISEVGDSYGDSFQGVANHLRGSLSELNIESLTKVALAYSVFGHRDPDVFQAISVGISQQLNSLTPVLITRVVTALSSCGYRDDKLFNELATKVTKLMPFFPADQLADVAMGFARLSIRNEKFFCALESSLLNEKRKDLSSKAVVKLAWAVAACDLDATRVKNFIAQHPERFNDLTGAHTAQLAQALLAIGVLNSQVERLAHKSQHSFKDRSSDHLFKTSVRDLLVKECGISEQDIQESLVIAGIESDLLIKRGARGVIIECDGDRYHLTWGPDAGKPLGRDVVQDRARATLGYEVVHVLASDLFHGRRDEVVAFLRQALGASDVQGKALVPPLGKGASFGLDLGSVPLPK